MLRVFKNKEFSRYSRRSGIQDADLCQAVNQINQGIIDADLGGGVIKQRMARVGGGKSGGFRTIVLFRSSSFAVFVYGFAKNERSNIHADELMAFRTLAAEVLAYSAAMLTEAVAAGAFTEVLCRPAGEDTEEVGNETTV